MWKYGWKSFQMLVFTTHRWSLGEDALLSRVTPFFFFWCSLHLCYRTTALLSTAMAHVTEIKITVTCVEEIKVNLQSEAFVLNCPALDTVFVATKTQTNQIGNNQRGLQPVGKKLICLNCLCEVFMMANLQFFFFFFLMFSALTVFQGSGFHWCATLSELGPPALQM